MKKFLPTLFLLFSPFAFAANKPNPADYTITVHVVGSGFRGCLSNLNCEDLQVLINGQAMELIAANPAYSGLLPLGDYQAKIVPSPNEPKKPDAYETYRRYELYLPNGELVRQFDLIGMNAPPQ